MNSSSFPTSEEKGVVLSGKVNLLFPSDPSGPRRCFAITNQILAIKEQDDTQIINLGRKASDGKAYETLEFPNAYTCALSEDRRCFALCERLRGALALKFWNIDPNTTNLSNLSEEHAIYREIKIPDEIRRPGRMMMSFLSDKNYLSFPLMINDKMIIAIYDLKKGLLTCNVTRVYKEELAMAGEVSCCSLVGDKLVTAQYADGLFVHNRKGAKLSAGVPLFSQENSNISYVTASPDGRVIAAESYDVAARKSYIRRLEVQDLKQEPGVKVVETGKFRCKNWDLIFFFTKDSLVFQDLDGRLCSVANGSTEPQIIASGEIAACCAMPNGNFFEINRAGEFKIHEDPIRALYQQALVEIVQQCVLADVSGLSFDIANIVRQMAQDPKFFSRPTSGIVEYNPTEKAVLKKVIEGLINHPFIGIHDKNAMSGFLASPDSLGDRANTVLNNPAISSGLNDFMDDLQVVFSQKKKMKY
ncbi:MAG: hypothetical protein ACYCQI_09920 [Gammaproteobacteria bacterium]